MDPTTTLAELRESIIRLGTPGIDVGDAINAVIERWSALDTWISNGGFPPAQWGNLTTKNSDGKKCWETTLAGTEIPVWCPELESDPWNQRGAYDDPAVRRAIAEHVRDA